MIIGYTKRVERCRNVCLSFCIMNIQLSLAGF